MNDSFDRFSTTTCETISASSTSCVTVSRPEITYYDWLTVNLWIIFSLSFVVLGFFFSPLFRSKSYLK